MISTYRPHYGSVPDRAIAHLRAAGGAVAARPIADAIDVDLDVLHNALRMALQSGTVVKEKREGLIWYSLGNGPLPAAEQVGDVDPDEVDDAPIVQRVFHAPQRASSPVEKPEVAPLPRVRAGTAPFRCGVFSDGELHLQKAGQSIVLERVEFETLVHFLERMAEGAA